MSALWKELLVELNAVGLERIERGKVTPWSTTALSRSSTHSQTHH